MIDDRVEFRRSLTQALAAGLFCLVAGVFLLSMAVDALSGVHRYNSPRAGSGPIAGLLLIGLAAFMGWIGARNLLALGDRDVKVIMDRDGITDLRLMPVPILWAEVERIEQGPVVNRSSTLRLVLRETVPQGLQPTPGREVLIAIKDLTGGLGSMKRAIGTLAPQVPRDW